MITLGFFSWKIVISWYIDRKWGSFIFLDSSLSQPYETIKVSKPSVAVCMSIGVCSDAQAADQFVGMGIFTVCHTVNGKQKNG